MSIPLSLPGGVRMRYLTWFPVENQLPEIRSKSDYSRDGAAYQGSPRKHPYDPNRILLLSGVIEGDEQICYDFALEDIMHVEDMENLVSFEGESLRVMKLWVRKGSAAFSLTPFEVE
jgi:hypothetical protein